MYRIVTTNKGNVIFVDNNGKTELYSGKNLTDFEGTLNNVDLNTANDIELARIAEKQIARRA